MQEFFPFVRDDILPSFWANAIQRLLSVSSFNFSLIQSSSTAIKVPALANAGAAVITINGKWRWNEADLTRSHPGGAAGTYLIYATAADNAIDNSPDPSTDHTVYAFNLDIRAGGTPTIVPGTVDIFRLVGTCEWDGAQITAINQTYGTPNTAEILAADPPIGAQMSYAGIGDPPGGKWCLADGRLILRALYPAFFARVGHAYNLGVDPGGGSVRIPDKRGRVSLGADNMGTGAGAAGRLPNTTNKTRGTSGGSERHSHHVMWPFGESGGAGNFVAAIHAGAASLTELAYTLRARITDNHINENVHGIARLIAAASSHDANLNGSPFSDVAAYYDSPSELISTLPNYEVDNVIVRIA